MEEVGPDNEIGLDDVNGGNVVDALDGGYTINDYGRNTSIWVLTSFVFLTSFRFMSYFAFLNFFVGLTSLDFELFWCLMLFVLFCCLTSLV